MIEKTVQKTYWYSDDGYEFSIKEQCEAYERNKKAADEGAKIPYIKVPQIISCDDTREARLYTLHTEADFQSLIKYLGWYKNVTEEVCPPESYPCLYYVVDPGTTFPIGFEITRKFFSDFGIFYETLKNLFHQE